MNQSSDFNPFLKNLGEDVMGFLNEIQLNYPEAISLASGRPDASFFKINQFNTYFNIFVDYLCELQNASRNEVLNTLGQYNRTKGIINELACKFLEKDEAIKVRPRDVLITVGSQEALSITLITLCDREKDIILVEEPTYVGITHFAQINGYHVHPVKLNSQGLELKLLEEKVIKFTKQGKKVKIVYVIPDHHNPTGNSMSLVNRSLLLTLASKYDFYIIEDNAYSEFSYSYEPYPSIKSLDKEKRVIYLRSLSKSLCPSLRIGIMVADQVLRLKNKNLVLSDLLAQTKGYLTVNTPSFEQAIVGGLLIKHKFTLKEFNKFKVENMQEKRNLVLNALTLHIASASNTWAKNVSWNIPDGGFFISVHVPFIVNKREVVECAKQFGVIITPMSFFYLKKGGTKQIRISFSNVKYEEVDMAISRLSKYIRSKTLNIK